MLETFRRAFSPDQTDFPSVSEDVTTENTSVSAGYADNGHLFLAQSTDSHRKSMLLMRELWAKSTPSALGLLVR